MPPHAFAMLASRLHGRCHLCHAVVTHPIQTHENFWANVPLLCAMCASDLTPPPVLALSVGLNKIPLYVGGFYDTPLDKVMVRFKDHHDVSALMVLYHVLSTLVKPSVLTAVNAVIVPVPTTEQRLAKRGFNPTLILAKYLSCLWQIPLFTHAYRHDNQTHQRGLSKAERLLNVVNDFAWHEYPTARHVVLFDDVITTGATLSAMAKPLIDGGCHRVHGVGVLHGKPQLHLPMFDKLA